MTAKELEALRQYLQTNSPARRVRPWGVECQFPWGTVVLPHDWLLEEFWTVPAGSHRHLTKMSRGEAHASA